MVSAPPDMLNCIMQALPAWRPYASVVEAVLVASRMTEHVRKTPGFGKLTKADASPVTVADLAAQMTVVSGIHRDFPSDMIIAEEETKSLSDPNLRQEIEDIIQTFNVPFNDFAGLSQPSTASTFWTIDPIDGTKGFLRNGHYAICVSRVENSTPTHSLVACPNTPSGFNENETGVLFLATLGNGVHAVSLETGAVRSLRRRTDPLEESVMVESVESLHTSHELSAGLRERFSMKSEPLRMDSQAKYGMLAQGHASIYLRRPRDGYLENIWDHCPGWLLVTEAGGRVTDFEGNEIVFNPRQHLSVKGGIVASMHSEMEHQKLVDYLKVI